MSESSKRRGLWPLPGGVESYFDTALALVQHVADQSPTEAQVVQHLRTAYGVTGDRSAPGYVRVLRNLGWVEAQDDLLVVTPRGRDLLASRDRLEAYRTLDERFVGIEATLRTISDGARTLDDVQAALNQALGTSWSSSNQAFFRLCWLRSLGLVARGEDGHLELSPAGQAVLQKARSAADLPQRPAEPVPPPIPTGRHAALEDLCSRLQAASVAGGDGVEFERVLAEAFRALGFDARHVGRAGNPDVLVHARRGDAPRRFVVDGKSASRGVVQEAQINWDSILDHKDQHDAHGAIAVGPSFAGGNLERRAVQKRIRLVRVDQLVHVLRAHALTPLGTDDLLPLLEGEGSLRDEDLAAFAIRVESYEQWPDLIATVFQTVWERQSEERAVLDTNSLFWILNGDYPSELIREAVTFLCSPVIRALAISDAQRLRTLCRPDVLQARLDVLRESLNQSEGPGGRSS